MTGISSQQPLGSGYSATSTAQEVLSGVDVRDATVLVTGGYSGLGLESTRALVDAGARVIVPARRTGEAEQRLAGVDCSIVPMDLADLASVEQLCERLLATEQAIDVLIACAGVMASPERRVGPGWESQLAINHLGHFALVNRLAPLLVAARGGARVVSYSSAGHQLSDIRWDDLHFGGGYNKWLAYGQSKTANVLFAVHLDAIAQAAGVRAFALHPGGIITDLQRELSRAEMIERGWVDDDGNVIGEGFKSPSQGAATGLWAATSPQLDGRGGVYCEDCDIAAVAAPDGTIADGGVRAYAVDGDSAARLWELSIELTGVDGDWGPSAR